MPFSIDDIQSMVRMLGEIFEFVRLVDPVECQVLVPSGDGHLIPAGRFCYGIWDRSVKCVNCISERAIKNQNRLMKCEALDGNIYNILAKPVTVLDVDGRAVSCCIEVVCHSEGEECLEVLEREELILRIVDAERRMYIDSLTEVYSRRFYDELAFCKRPDFAASGRVVFVMVDLKQFKQINDRFGHDVGDVALRRAAKVMMRAARTCDSVIRIGGDEFLIVLPDCGAECALEMIDRVKRGFRNASEGEDHLYRLVGNFGISTTHEFRADKPFVDRLLGEADRLMYLDKNCDKE